MAFLQARRCSKGKCPFLHKKGQGFRKYHFQKASQSSCKVIERHSVKVFSKIIPLHKYQLRPTKSIFLLATCAQLKYTNWGLKPRQKIQHQITSRPHKQGSVNADKNCRRNCAEKWSSRTTRPTSRSNLQIFRDFIFIIAPTLLKSLMNRG